MHEVTANNTSHTPDVVLEHIADLVRLRRPEIPSWVIATDLTFGQLRLLFRLRRSGPTAMGRLAAWLGVSLATATGIVERIEAHGLVAREHREDDRRVVDCQLTPAGAALVAEIDGLRTDTLRQAIALLDEAELAEFDRLLVLIIDRAREREGDAGHAP